MPATAKPAKAGKPTPPPSDFMTRQEAAAFCRLNVQTIDLAIKNAELRRFKIGRRVLLSRADLVRWVEGKEA
jgi:excisionase family DNA binding protein